MRIFAAAIALTTGLFFAAQTEEPGIQINFQEVMIPMRDGVRLQTVILSPKNPKGPLPFLIDRTPYGLVDRETVAKSGSPDRSERWENYYNVYQNIRGRFKSEGKFVMGRPPHDASDSKGTDETTDAWDTVDWLVKNIPNNNGRAGIAGTSYGGWTTVMAALNPHPALKAAIEQASPADQFLGDDFHHNGAFRLSYGFEYSACFAEMIQNDNGYLGKMQPPGSQEAAMAGDDPRSGVYENGVIEPERFDACRNLSDLRVGVGPGIPGQGNQLVDQPQLDVLYHRLLRRFRDDRLTGAI
jgi:uncharacterized protein